MTGAGPAKTGARTMADINVTDQLARYVLSAGPDDLPANVQREAKRSLLNILGCVIGGARHATVDMADEALADMTGPGQATLLGRGRKSDVLHATLLNCIASSVYGYDDTHAEAIVHPSGPVFAAALALSERIPVHGRDLLTAFALGVEITCRLSKAISVPPARGTIAWSQTGITCSIGAVLASGKLLGLDVERMRWAIGIAASQAAGMRSLHGTMCTALTPAHAGQTGLRAALLAARGFTGGSASLEKHNGYFDVFCEEANFPALLGGLGQHFEILRNTYKPYPCGIVIHPILDACLQLRRQHSLDAGQIERVDIKASPGAMALCNRRNPRDEFEAHVSLHHWAAAALMNGTAGIEVLDEACVHEPAIVALQDCINAAEDVSRGSDSCEVTIALKDGRTLVCGIDHGIGSATNPMTDAQLEVKFLGLSEPVLGAERSRKLIAACRNLEHLADAGAIARDAM